MGAEKIEPANSGKNMVSEDNMYDIIVSFASRASGINHEARESLEKTITDFNQENKVTVFMEKQHWGREGEVDYLFLTKNLSTKQKKELKAKIKVAVGSADLVFISYDAKAVHKR
jgi:hypothetical protein